MPTFEQDEHPICQPTESKPSTMDDNDRLK